MKAYLFGKGESILKFDKSLAKDEHCFFVNDSVFWGNDIETNHKWMVMTDNVPDLLNDCPNNVKLLTKFAVYDKDYEILGDYGWGICTANYALNYLHEKGYTDIIAVGFDGSGKSLSFHQASVADVKHHYNIDPNFEKHRDWHYGRYQATMVCQAHYLKLNLTFI
jgi:hypothetical protein